MEKLIEKLDANKNKYNTEFFAELQKDFSFGLYVKTPNDKNGNSKTIFESEKEIYVKIIIKAKDKYEIQSPDWKLWHSLLPSPDLICKSPYIAIVRKNSDEAFSNHFGKIAREKLGVEHVIFDYEGDLELEEVCKKRISETTAICEKFGVNAKNNFYMEPVIARSIAHTQLKHFSGVEKISHEEMEIIEGSVRGAVQYARKNTQICDVFDYDVNTMYGFIMSSTDLRIPLVKPAKRSLDKHFENSLEIYKLKINGTHKYWADTKNDYYNTYHIEILKLLNIPFEYDGNKKFVYYDATKSSDMFGYLKDIFEMKKSGVPAAKGVLSSTWGALSRKKNYQIPIEDLDEKCFDRVLQLRLDKGYAVMMADSNPYKHVTGRLKPFLLAYVRLFLLKNMILPLESKGFEIYQINTDGFITNAKPEEMQTIYKIGSNMGELKLEKEFSGTYDIKHVRLIEKHDEFDDSFF